MNSSEQTGARATAEKSKEESIESVAGTSKTFTPTMVDSETMFEKLAKLTKETAQKAFEFFQERGGELGKELDDWFNAESKILRPVAVEIAESDGVINVSAAVPGFRPEEIEISVKGDLLVLSGQTEKREERSDANVVYSDWESNRFFRQLTLPSSVNAENVSAELKDGILRLSLPKAAGQGAKQIAVKAG